jgi:hypothetical protein
LANFRRNEQQPQLAPAKGEIPATAVDKKMHKQQNRKRLQGHQHQSKSKTPE